MSIFKSVIRIPALDQRLAGRVIKIILCFITLHLTCIIYAQVPYFGKTPGNQKLYGYTSVKFRPGVNNIETYNTFQYGITDFAAIGLDYYTGTNCAYMGYMLRTGYKVNQYFSIGSTATPSFDLNDNYKFSYFTGGLFMNGSITNNSRLFWCTNTWFGVNKDKSYTVTQFSYLGYEFAIENGDGITPMAGISHSWKFDEKIDVAAGFYYTHKNWNLYVWGNDFLQISPRLVVGIDFKF